MTDKKDSGKLAPKKLTLTRTVEKGVVQQTFSKKKSKSVMVEIKKSRTFSRKDGVLVEDKKASNIPVSTEEAAPTGLTASEEDVRRIALLKAAEDEKKKQDSSDSDSEMDGSSEEGVSEDEISNGESEEDLASDVEEGSTEESKDSGSEEVAFKRQNQTKSKKRKREGILDEYVEHSVLDKGKKDSKKDSNKAKPKEGASSKTEVKVAQPTEEKEEKKFKTPSYKEEEKKTDHKAKPRMDGKRRKGKLTISNAFDQEEKMRSLASIKRARQKAKRQSTDVTTQEKTIREVVIPESISVQELANRLAVRVQEVTKELMKLGIIVQNSEDIDADTAELVVTELGHKFKRVTEGDVENILIEENVLEEDLEARNPIVTIMGHVDHGKTSLLDALRSTNVTEGEAGGITQHIAAYKVVSQSGDEITFLDTPGHAAFTAMRARGAKVTDIVVLIVAADDGIMPQTIEAISHAKAAEVPIIVAINKIDKPDANPQKVKEQLLSYELIPEDLGGDVMVVEISAKERINLDGLLETILLQSEMLELKASKKQKAIGTVVEAHLDKGKGVVATIIVQRGTLRTGDIVIAGCGSGKVKTMFDDHNKSVNEAYPSDAVQLLGLSELPNAGDQINVTDTEKQAREISEYREKIIRDEKAVQQKMGGLANIFNDLDSGTKELNLIIKGDVQGSVEAIQGSLANIDDDEVKIKYVHTGSGAISESDVALANATGALIVGFNVRANSETKRLAEEEVVEIKYYSIIYNLIEDMKTIISGLMSPILREEFLGNATIKEIFKMSKYGKVAGCIVTEGMVKRGASVRLVRDNIVIHEGKLKTLRRFKESVQEVKKGIECGMAFENYEDIREGDVIEAFEIIEEQRKLD